MSTHKLRVICLSTPKTESAIYQSFIALAKKENKELEFIVGDDTGIQKEVFANSWILLDELSTINWKRVRNLTRCVVKHRGKTMIYYQQRGS